MKDAGYPKKFVETMLPEWWDNRLLETSSGILQFALFAKQRFGLEVKFSEDGSLQVTDDTVQVRFKHRKGTSQDDLTVVKNLGKAVASIVKYTTPEYRPLPSNAMELREIALGYSNNGSISFEALLQVCWTYGIPVFFLDKIPRSAKRMTGMVVNQSGNPTILLGFRHDHRSRQLFVLAHELAHILLGHVGANALLIDNDLDFVEDTLVDQSAASIDDEERQADRFALEVIRGVRELSFDTVFDEPSELAMFALEEGGRYGIDSGHIITSYAFDTLDWPTANSAMKFMTEPDGAINLIREKFKNNANFDQVSEETADYLDSLQGLI